MTKDRPLLGIGLMLGFCVMAPMGDSIAKYLGGIIPITQLVAVRFLMQVLFLLPFVWALGLTLRMSRRHYWLIFLRTLT